MDTGDATGDMFFDLFEVIINPLVCASGSQHSGSACTNPEAISPNLMVNKLVLEVDSRYSTYAKCNIGINGTDGRGHACKDGTYCCFCEQGYGREVPCERTVGRQDLFDEFGGGGSRHHGFCHFWSSAAECYISNTVKKLSTANPGYWYSSLASGYCDGAGPGCTWRVVAVEKIVTRRCHTRVFGEAVAATAPGCFDGCGDQRTNTSSPCWVDCFYKAALGPDAGKPGAPAAGMTLDDLVAAWEKPFSPPELGGCPPQQELPSWYVPAAGPAALL